MTKHEAILYIRNFLKTANTNELRNVICGINGPRCSDNCPLKQKSVNCECKEIQEDEE